MSLESIKLTLKSELRIRQCV